MPDASLSQALEEAYASAPAGEVILHTLEFRHAAFSQPIRVVRDYTDLTATLEATAPLNPSTAVTFVAYPFELQLPDVTTGPSPEVVITIDNVARDILANMDLAADSGTLVEVTYRAYLLSDLTHPQNNPPLTMVVRDIEADIFHVTARASFGEYANKPFPGEIYSLDRFPGLVVQ